MPHNPVPGTDNGEILNGTSAPDLIDALGGNDTIDAGTGNDLIYAGDGDDSVQSGDGRDIVHGGEGNDLVEGGYGDDTLFGGAGTDIIWGGQGQNRLYGGGGNDLLIGTDFYWQNDAQLFGGNGDDELVFYVNSGGVAVGGSGTDTLRLQWYNPAGPITVDLGGPSPSATEGTTVIHIAGIEALNMNGSYEDDWISGGAGNDVVNVLGGANMLNGNAGNDYLGYWTGLVNLIDGGDGVDTLRIGMGLYGPPRIAVTGTTATDGIGSTLINFEKFDVYGNIGNDVAELGGMADKFFGHQANDTAYGFGGNDRLHGQLGDDSLYGGSGNDLLTGGLGYDVLDGGDGNDTLIGGIDRDVMTGGAGADVFQFKHLDQYPDSITDFQSGTDKIRVLGAALGANFPPGAIDPSLFALGAPTANHSQFVYVDGFPNGASVLYFNDLEGLWGFNAIAEFDGIGSFTAADIVFY